jgi:hypothetical protein
LNHQRKATDASVYTELEAARADLAGTLSELVDKTDIKSRAQQRLHDTQTHLAQATWNANRHTRLLLKDKRVLTCGAATLTAVAALTGRRLRHRGREPRSFRDGFELGYRDSCSRRC